MSINERLTATLSGLTPSGPAADTKKGNGAEYIVFNYSMIPADFGDDDAGHYLALVQVHEKNNLPGVRERRPVRPPL